MFFDLVFLIDVLGSMGVDVFVLVKNGIEGEYYGLLVLDFVRYVVKIILEILDDYDRLGIVMFSISSKVSLCLCVF